ISAVARSEFSDETSEPPAGTESLYVGRRRGFSVRIVHRDGEKLQGSRTGWSGKTGAGGGFVPLGGRVRGHRAEMIFFFILLLLVVVAQITEFFIPPLDWMYHAHIYIAPVLVFYGAMALPFPLMLALALVAGILLDALTVQVIGSKDEI